MSAGAKRDAEQRAAMDAVAAGVAALNDALRTAMGLKIRVEFGSVESEGYDKTKKARRWVELWSEEGVAVRFTREEIVAAPKPPAPVVDEEPRIP